MTKFASALKFFFCDSLTGDDVFDWHCFYFNPSRPPLKGRRKNLHATNTPSQLGKGWGMGQIVNLLIHTPRVWMFDKPDKRRDKNYQGIYKSRREDDRKRFHFTLAGLFIDAGYR